MLRRIEMRVRLCLPADDQQLRCLRWYEPILLRNQLQRGYDVCGKWGL